MLRHSTILILLLSLFSSPAFAEKQDYLYYRDVNVPAFQTLREFFDLPNRPGRYEITLVSEDTGPLTFSLLRVNQDHEKSIIQKRSFKFGEHEFQSGFDNPRGNFDLIVVISNSNPATKAKVSVYVVELP